MNVKYNCNAVSMRNYSFSELFTTLLLGILYTSMEVVYVWVIMHIGHRETGSTQRWS